MTFEKLIDQELEARQIVKDKVMELVLQEYEIGKGRVMRGQVQNYLWESMGFQGHTGKHFSIFVNQVMAEHGIRITYHQGYRIYAGLMKRENVCDNANAEQKSDLKSNTAKNV